MFSLAAAPVRWQLPKKLNEASGLALSKDGRIFTHNDEKGIVYHFNADTGDIDTVFKIDDPAIRADFEAVAIIDKDFFLITSDGVLYPVPDALDFSKEIVSSAPVETGLAEICEVEGLASFLNDLYIACKTNYRESDKHELLVYRFNPRNLSLKEFLRLPHETLGLKSFPASGIAITSNAIYIISARKRQMLLVSHDGHFIGRHKLKKKYHRQVEGISVTSDGKIYLVDEGKGKGGQFSSYFSEADL
jgi:uncharacterized protein YjiK